MTWQKMTHVLYWEFPVFLLRHKIQKQGTETNVFKNKALAETNVRSKHSHKHSQNTLTVAVVVVVVVVVVVIHIHIHKHSHCPVGVVVVAAVIHRYTALNCRRTRNELQNLNWTASLRTELQNWPSLQDCRTACSCRTVELLADAWYHALFKLQDCSQTPLFSCTSVVNANGDYRRTACPIMEVKVPL